jgi:hypothetical protein
MIITLNIHRSWLGHSVLTRIHAREDLAEDLPPIAGGSPAYEPTPQDWEEYRRHFDAVDAETVRDWYRRHPLSEFNAVRPDSDGDVD